MNSELLQLKNIGKTSAYWLHIVGVNSYEDLKTLGATAAYLKIQQRGIKTSKVLLYALHGALMNVHWNSLEPSLKENILQELNEYIQSIDEK
jgi:DNA transformation protein